MDAFLAALTESPVVLVCGIVFLVVVAALGRRLDVRIGSVHAQLTPNGGSSVRDAIDRIETQAKSAVDRAETAALQATVAARHAAEALDRIEKLEQQRPSATAIVVQPPLAPPESSD